MSGGSQDPLCQFSGCHTLQQFLNSFIIVTAGDLLQNVIRRLNVEILNDSVIDKLHQAFGVHVVHHFLSIVLNELPQLIVAESSKLGGDLIVLVLSEIHWSCVFG